MISILCLIVAIIICGKCFWGWNKIPKVTEFGMIDGEPIVIGEKEMPDEPPSVILKQPKFDTSKIKSYEGGEQKAFEFRPQTWKQFIGQEEAKDEVQTIIKKVKRGIKGHILVNGIRGHGKTSFIELLAKNLNAKLIEKVGKQMEDPETLVNVINEINESKEEYVIFFIDEIDTMKWQTLKMLNPIIESFKIDGKKIKPFIFASATINKHILKTKTPDTLDRIPHHIVFKRYSSQEIAKIVKQYTEQLYPDDVVSEEVIRTISENCKFNPRTAISLLGNYIVENNITKVLKTARVVKDGLTDIDIKILTVLNNASRPMGLNAVAGKVGLSPKDYSTEYEEFLYEYNYINRVPSRVIGEEGKKILKELEEESCGQK